MNGDPRGPQSFDHIVLQWTSCLHDMYSGSEDFHLFDDRTGILVQEQPDIQALGLWQGEDPLWRMRTCSVDPTHAMNTKMLYHDKIRVAKVKDQRSILLVR